MRRENCRDVLYLTSAYKFSFKYDRVLCPEQIQQLWETYWISSSLETVGGKQNLVSSSLKPLSKSIYCQDIFICI
jgi:hypothetical protein